MDVPSGARPKLTQSECRAAVMDALRLKRRPLIALPQIVLRPQLLDLGLSERPDLFAAQHQEELGRLLENAQYTTSSSSDGPTTTGP